MKNEFEPKKDKFEEQLEKLGSISENNKGDLIVESVNQIISHINGLEAKNDDAINQGTGDAMKEALDEAKFLTNLIIEQLSAVFDEFKDTEVPVERTKIIADQIIIIEGVLSKAENPSLVEEKEEDDSHKLAA